VEVPLYRIRESRRARRARITVLDAGTVEVIVPEGTSAVWIEGFVDQHRAWIDDLTVPFSAMRGYIEKLEAGEDIARPLKHIREESERVFGEFRDLLSGDDAEAFSQMRQLAKTVYPFVENHNFYVEHWHHSIFWNKVRELGAILQAQGFLEDSEDVFFLHRYEAYNALFDMLTAWATANPGRPGYWLEEVEVRRALGPLPAYTLVSPPDLAGTIVGAIDGIALSSLVLQQPAAARFHALKVLLLSLVVTAYVTAGQAPPIARLGEMLSRHP